MVVKKFIKRGDKTFGPYYYESVREGNKVKKDYIGGEKEYKEWKRNKGKKDLFKKNLFKKSYYTPVLNVSYKKSFFIFLLILVIVGAGFLLFSMAHNSFTGFAINQNMTEIEKQAVLYENEIVNQEFNVSSVNLMIKEPPKVSGKIINKNKNKRMDFDTLDGSIRLYFDLLNYSEFVENLAEEINVGANATKVNITAEVNITETNLTEVNITEEVNVTANLTETNATEINITIPSNVSLFVNETVNETLPESNATINATVSETNETVINESETNIPIEVPSENPIENETVPEEQPSAEQAPAEQQPPSEEGISSDVSSEGDGTSSDVSSEGDGTSSDVSSEGQGITGSIIRIFGVPYKFIQNLIIFTGRVIGLENETIGMNINLSSDVSSENQSESINNIIREINITEVKEKTEDLGSEVVSDIADQSVVEAESFDVEVSSVPNGTENSKNAVKWGYRVKLNDLNFMAKIEVTTDEKLFIYNNETLKIGRNLLSFKDLVDAGYKIRFETPTLEMEVNVTTSIINTMDNLTEGLVDNDESVVNETINNTNQVVGNVTEVVNESGENNNIISEIINETIDNEETQINETLITETPSQPLDNLDNNTSQIRITGNVIISSVAKATESTGNFFGFVGRVIGIGEEQNITLIEDVNYNNTIIVYIEKDFTNNSEGIVIGDIINLDPTLIIIEIIKAEHLNKKREFISDIYNETRYKDNNWSEEIKKDEYVRVVFEQNLTKGRDITIYARNSKKNPAEISVYRQDSDEEITRFTNITDENWYKIYLTNLSENESLDTFDLKILNNPVEFDYIVDPTPGATNVSDCMTLSTAGTYYQLNTSISNDTVSGNGCIIISAQNITFDCDGFSITSASNNSGVYSNQVNTTVKNCNVSMGTGNNTNTVGIEMTDAADYSTIYNNTIWDNGVNGMYYGIITGAEYQNISNNNVNVSCVNCIGIYLTFASNNNLDRNNATAGTGNGIWLYNTNNHNILTGNTGTSNSGNGILLNQYSINNTLTNNLGTSNSGNGIDTSSNNNTFTGNTGTSNSNIGIKLNGNTGGTLTSNTGTSNSNTGIYLGGSLHNLTNNTGTSNSNTGIYIYGGSNILTGNTGTSNSSAGVQIYSGSHNIIINQNATGYLTNSYGIYLFGGTNNTFQDCIQVSGVKNDVLLFAGNKVNATFINCSYRITGTNESVGSTDTLTRKWYYLAYVNDTNGLGVSNANVSAYNVTGSAEFEGLMTNSSGWTNITTITEYANTGGTRSYYSNYTINATNSSYQTGSHTYNVSVSLNNLGDVFSLNEGIIPTLTIIYPANNSNFNSSSVSFNVSSNENLSWCGLSIDYNTNVTMTLNASLRGGNYTNSSIGDGNHNFTISCNDTAGNTNTTVRYFFLVDTVYPTLNISSPVNGSYYNNATPLFNISSSEEGTGTIVPNLDNSLVSWWRMDDVNSTGTKVIDYMNRNNGTASGAVQTDAGKMGKGFSFDGNDDYISIPASSSFYNFSLMTINMWINIKKIGVANRFLRTDTTGACYNEILLWTDNYFNFHSCMNGSQTIDAIWSAPAYSANTWYMVTLAFNGTNWLYYRNSTYITKSGSYAGKTVTMTMPMLIGRTTQTINGSIDDIIIFNRSLTSEEIVGLYNATRVSHSGISLVDGSHTFTAYTQDLAANVNSSTIGTFSVDTSYPGVNITYPLNTTYTNYVVDLNYTISETNPSRCWYGNGSINYTAVSAGTNWTGLNGNSTKGSNTWTVWCNDTAGNTNSSSVTFTVDNTNPTLNISSPVNASYYSNASVLFNVSSSEAGTGSIIPNLDNSLVSWWRMDDVNSSGTGVIDYMGRNNGTNSGANQTDSGKIGKAMSFDGSNSAINTNSEIIGTGEDSLCSWIYPLGVGESSGFTRILDNGQIILLHAFNKLRFTSDAYTGNAYSGANSILYNLWSHICVVRNSTGITNIYVNGILSGTANQNSGTPTTGTTNLFIGNRANIAATFNGSIDDVMIFNRSLTASEIVGLYNATSVSHSGISLADGSHTFTAYTEDLAANVNSSSAGIFSVDTVFPTINFTSPTEISGSYLNRNNILINVSVVDTNFVNVTVYLYNSSKVINQTNVSTTQPYFINYTNLANGVYYFNATTYDSAGNKNDSETRNVTVDTVYPTWSGNKTNLSSATAFGESVYFNITLSDNNPEYYVFSWYNGTNWVNNSASVYTNGQEISVVKQINIDIGDINWTWYVNDTAGNLNQTSIWSVSLIADDNIAPNVTFISPANGGYSGNRTVYFVANFSDNVALKNATLYVWNSSGSIVNNTENRNITGVLNSTNISVVLPYDGSFVWNYYSCDNNGNCGFNTTTNWSVVVDTVYPSVTINSPLNQTYSVGSILFNASINENGTCRFSLNNGAVNISMTSTDNRNFNATNNSIADGGYSVVFYCNDTSGNMNSSSVGFTVDTQNPVVNIAYPTDNSYINYNSSVSLNYSISTNNTQACWYSLDNGINNTINNCLNISLNLSEGNHLIKLWINSSAGLVGSDSVNFTVDLTAPAVNLISPADAVSYTSNLQSVIFNYNITEANSVENCSLIINNNVNMSNSSISNLSLSYNFTQSFAPGTYYWSVNCSDIVLNTGNSSRRSFVVSAPAVETPASSSSGGGGGGAAPVKAEPNLVIDTRELQVPIVINTVKMRKISLTNTGNKDININIKLQNISNILSLEQDSFVLAPGEKKDIELKFIGPEDPGIYTGKVLINGQEVLISVNVNTKELFFDAGVVIPDELKMINIGDKLSSQITIVPMGENPRLDVTLNYVIKDFNGRTFLTESETLLIEGQKTFKKEFATQNLPAGDYVLGLELIYPNGVATSTSHFEVAKKENAIATNSPFYIILIALGIGILILIILTILIIKKPKMRKPKNISS